MLWRIAPCHLSAVTSPSLASTNWCTFWHFKVLLCLATYPLSWLHTNLIGFKLGGSLAMIWSASFTHWPTVYTSVPPSEGLPTSGVQFIRMPGKWGSGTTFQLHPSEKAFPEWHYGAICQKNTPLNSHNICMSCGGNTTHLQLWEQLVRDLTVLFNEGDFEVNGVPRGWSSNSEAQMCRPEVKHSLPCQLKEKSVPVMCAKWSKWKNTVLMQVWLWSLCCAMYWCQL
jgi:hypothetical protein